MNGNDGYVAERSSSSSNVSDENNDTDSSNSVDSATPPPETQVAVFSTKIYTKEAARQNNMNITVSKLNGHVVKNGETFSFCDTLGPSSSDEGYQKADIFDNNGNKKKGLGGGNCQISSTLYNAVIATPGLDVVERHSHSNYVPYIQKGKDAAVAYGSYDFKFVNQTGNDIKLNFQSSASDVTVSIVSLKVQ